MKKLLRKVSGYIRHTDILLCLFCLAASGFSVLALAAMANTGYVDLQKAVVQAGATGMGFLGALILSKIDYHTLARLWKLHLPLCVLLVLMTFVIGQGVGDADDVAWIPILGGAMSLQPSEVLKISFIITFAYHLSRTGAQINSLRATALLVLHAGAMILLVHFQGDDGTALIFVFIFLSMMFVAGWSLWYFLAGALLLAVGTPVLWFYIMNDDQRLRISALYTSVVDTTNILYQQNRGVLALSSGQMLGTGLFSGEHSYVPAMHNDFILSFIGEAMGFIGCLAVILFLVLICVRCIWASHLAVDELGRSMCVGVFAMIAFQAIINIGMNIKLLPVVGVTLPFFSAGGTSVVALYLGIGVVLSVFMHSRRNLFLDS